MLTIVPSVPRPRTDGLPSEHLRRLANGVVNTIQRLALEEDEETLTVLALISDRGYTRLRHKGGRRGRVSPR